MDTIAKQEKIKMKYLLILLIVLPLIGQGQEGIKVYRLDSNMSIIWDTTPTFKIIGKPIMTHRVIYVANKERQIEAVSDTYGNWVLEGGSFSEFMEIFYKEHSKMIKLLQKKVDSLKEVADSYEYLLNDCIMASDTSSKVVGGFMGSSEGTPPPYTVDTDSVWHIIPHDSSYYGIRTMELPIYPYDNRPEYDTVRAMFFYVDTSYGISGSLFVNENINIPGPKRFWVEAIRGYIISKLGKPNYKFGNSRYYQHYKYLDEDMKPLSKSIYIIMAIKK